MQKSKRARGLCLRNGVYHLDKVIFGQRICESARTAVLKEAQKLLSYRVNQVRQYHLYGRTFRQAAARYLAEYTYKRCLSRDQRALVNLDPYIGALPVGQVCGETLNTFIRARLARGLSPGTVNRDLAVVRVILNLCWQVWRDRDGIPWLEASPYIARLKDVHARQPYPLGVDEQDLLFSELPEHLRLMAEFKVNTGLREQEVVQLRWEWEVAIPELQTSIFVIPKDFVKSLRDRYVVMNSAARNVLEQCRGRHPQIVFTRDGKPVTKIYNTGWRSARRRASERYERDLKRPCPHGFRSFRVHDLKHTLGFRLRAARVDIDDRHLLLGHRAGPSMATHYSAAEIGSLIDSLERVCGLVSTISPHIAIVRYETGSRRLKGVPLEKIGRARAVGSPVRLPHRRFNHAERILKRKYI